MLVAKMESSQQHPHVHAWTVAVSVYRFPRAPHPPTHPPTHPTRARARVRARAHTQATASPRPQIKTVHCVILSARFWSVFGCKKKIVGKGTGYYAKSSSISCTGTIQQPERRAPPGLLQSRSWLAELELEQKIQKGMCSEPPFRV